MTRFEVSQEFKDFLPPLSEEEFRQLEANILADGCLDTLKIWHGWLIDGHNRYEICKKHGVSFQTVELQFPDKTAVLMWMLQNNLGRRNILPAQRIELVLKYKPMIQEQAQQNKVIAGQLFHEGSNKEEVLANSPKPLSEPVHTRDVLANLAGVSSRMFANAAAVFASTDEPTKQAMRIGDLSIHAAYTVVTTSQHCH